MITGAAGTISLVPMLTPVRTPATAGATSAMAPMVAIHPPSTDTHEVAGRTTVFTIDPPVKKSGARGLQNAGQPVAGQPAKRPLPSRQPPSRTYRPDRSFPTADLVSRNARRKRSPDRWAGATQTAR